MNSEKFTSHFTMLRARMRSVGHSLLGSSDDVDDAIQDTFCRLWSRHESIDENHNVDSYALTTMRNVCVDRKRSGESTVEYSDQYDQADEPEPHADELYDEVMRIINNEPTPLQRTIVTMHDVDGLEYSVIASRLGIEQAAVRMNLSRARKSIRTIYKSRL